MESETTYARARLRLGIATVGLWVVFATVALASRASLSIETLIFLHLVLSAPSDYLGGYLLPRRYGRPHPTQHRFLLAWTRGALAQSALLFLSANALLWAGKQAGVAGALVAASALMLAALRLREPLARIVGKIARLKTEAVAEKLAPVEACLQTWGLLDRFVFAGNPSPAPNTQNPKPTLSVAFVASRDIGFTGGFVRDSGSGTVLLAPAAWLSELAPEIVAAQLVRRLGIHESGAAWRGDALGFLFNLAGLAFALTRNGAGVGSEPELVNALLYFTLVSFLGLLILPTLTRPAVADADRFAQDAGVPRETLVRAIEALDARQDDEPARSELVETIFHPIASVKRRIDALGSGDPGESGAWQGARTALFLSTFCGGLLARAVHCNAGRPELWTLYPGD